MIDSQVDIKENEIFELSPELLNTLLKDHTLSSDECQVNIFWATDSYASRGKGYQYTDQITIDAITGATGNIIVPRAVKSRQEQQTRSREMAEVFTPSWTCNKQNNLIVNAWFGREGVIPNSCVQRRTVVYDLFGQTETISQCQGWKSGNIKKHNGTYALIKDWSAPKAKQKIRFIDLM